MIYSQIITRQKDKTPRSRFSDRNLSQKSSKDGNSQLTVFKLRIINLSSENLTIKKKLADCQEALNKAKMYQIAFNNAIRVINQLKHQKQTSTPDKGRQLSKDPLLDQLENHLFLTADQTILKKTDSIQLDSPSIAKKTSTYKLEQYEFLKQLVPGQGHETVQSLELSLDSEQPLEQSRQTKQSNCNSDMFALRQEYQSARLHMENIYQTKIKLLNDKIEELKRQNKRLLNKLKQKQSDSYILEVPELQGRETAYFPQIEAISENEFEDSIDANEIDKTLDACLKKIEKENKSEISQNWTQAAEQMRSVKATLQKIHSVLQIGASDVLNILSTLYNLRRVNQKIKIISLKQYMGLLQAKKNNSIASQRCNCLQKQVSKLKIMIRDLL